MNSNSPILEQRSKIAEYLVECARDRTPQTYGYVCQEMASRHGHTHSPQTLSKSHLDAINNESCKLCPPVLISVLVVSTKNKFKGKKMPGVGFFKVWTKLDPKDRESCYAYFIEERDNVYNAADEDKLDIFINGKAFF